MSCSGCRTSTRARLLRVRPFEGRVTGYVAARSCCSQHLGSAQDKPGAPATPAAADNKPAEFVGSTTCQMCHEDIFNAFQKNPHQVVETDKKRGWDTKACESCHGPGSKHAESVSAADIKQPAKLKPSETESHLPHLPSKPGHPRRPSEQQSCQEPGELHGLPCHPQEWTARPGGAQAGGDQRAVRRMPHRCLGELPAPLQTPPARRRHVVRGLPQSARQRAAARSIQTVRVQRTGLRASATAIRWALFRSNMLRCGWKAAAPAISRTARPIRAC